MEGNPVKEHFAFRNAQNQRFVRENINSSISWSLSSTFRNENDEFLCDILQEAKETPLFIRVYQIKGCGIRIRIEIKEEEPHKRFDLSKQEAVVNQEIINSHSKLNVTDENEHYLLEFEGNDEKVKITKENLVINLMKGDKNVMQLNSCKNLVFEYGCKQVPQENHYIIYRDPIPNGASSVGIDIKFLGEDINLSGFSQRASPLNLSDTVDPIRLFNTDAFKYTHDNPIHIYGNVPFLMSHNTQGSAGIFWINSSDTYASINTVEGGRKVQLISETGYFDIVLFIDDFNGLMTKYTNITGKPLMPPIFSLGYHQCKWGYKSQEEVENIMINLDKVDIPYDAIWLDVDHLEGYAPFQVNRKTFPNIEEMEEKLEKDKRYLIRLCDPHFPTKRTHKQYSEALKYNYLMRDPSGSPYTGRCWPGKCSWPDFLNPECREWYSKQYHYGADNRASNLFIWNDMNEPSIFGSDQCTFPKKLLHFDGTESRETHNIYGLLNTSATYKGLYDRDEIKARPFILTRSFFSGSQKYAFVWTGDNTSSWEHMKISLDMILTNGICGIPFIGADVGGFFGSVPADLIARWFQVGAWCYTFFREHAVFQAAYREPYLFTGDAFNAMKNAVHDRYKMLAFFYTESFKTHKTGIPVIRPLWSVFSNVNELQHVSNEIMIGESILVAPVLEKDATTITIIKPPGNWYSIWQGKLLEENETLQVGTLDIPVFIRGGKIIPVYSEIGKSALLTMIKPINLIIALDNEYKAEGEIFLDDGRSFDFEENKFINNKYIFENSELKCINQQESTPINLFENTYITKITIYGFTQAPSSIGDHQFTFENGVLNVDVNFSVSSNWNLKIE